MNRHSYYAQTGEVFHIASINDERWEEVYLKDSDKIKDVEYMLFRFNVAYFTFYFDGNTRISMFITPEMFNSVKSIIE